MMNWFRTLAIRKRKVTMQLAIVILLGFIALVLVVILCLLAALLDQAQVHTKTLGEIRQFQMNPRTRMKRARMRNKPRVIEDDLEKVGRIAAPRRVVVGGEPSSEQHHRLSRTTAVEE